MFNISLILASIAALYFFGLDWRFTPLYLCAFIAIVQLILKTKPNKKWLMLGGLSILLTGTLLLFLPTIKFNPLSGEYAVGVTEIEIHDNSRQRTLPSKIWFPITDTTGLSRKQLWITDFDQVSQALAKLSKVPAFTFSHLRNMTAGYSANYESRVINNKPLILLSHGRSAIKEFNTFMALELASLGYTVATVNHTSGALVTVLNDGTVIPFDKKEFGEEKEYEEDEKLRIVQALGKKWATDLRFLEMRIKEALNLSSNHNTIAAGHSTGGGASINYCSSSKTCLGAIGLDPWFKPVSSEILIEGSNKPVLNLFSDPEEADMEAINQDRYMIMATAMQERDIFVEAQYIDKSGHVDFCDAALISPYSYLLGQDKGKVSTHKVMDEINKLSLEFIQMLQVEK